MKINKITVMSLLLAVSGFCPAVAQQPLSFEHLNQVSHNNHASANNLGHHNRDHDNYDRYSNDRYNKHQYNNRHGYRDPWRWGAGWNNHWGPSVGIGWSSGYRWGNDWRDPWYNNGYSPYRYGRDNHYARREVYVEPTVMVSPPQRTTTSLQYDSGIRSLPENAKAFQQNGKMVYEWQGVIYQYDWSTETYVKAVDQQKP